MRNRNEALAAVRDRISRAVSDRDSSNLLIEQALAEAEELAALVDLADDLEAAHALGMLHWFRYLALPDGAGQDDLAAAVRFLAPVFQADPEAIPEPLRVLSRQTNGRSGDTAPESDAAARRAFELFTAYQRTGELPLLIEQVQAGRLAVAATPADHPDRAMVLHNLADALWALHERTWDTAVRAEAVHAVQASQDAAAAAPADHAARAATARAFFRLVGRRRNWQVPSKRAEETGRMEAESTGDSVKVAEDVQDRRDLAAGSSGGHPASYLHNLAGLLLQLSQDTGDIAVAEEAVQAGRDAVAATTESDRLGWRLFNLGGALQQLAGLTRQVAVQAEAVQAYQNAVAAMPTGYPARIFALDALGVAWEWLSAYAEYPAAEAEAVQVYREAAAVITADVAERFERLSTLADRLLKLFEHYQDVALLEEAVQVTREAVTLTPAGHSLHAQSLHNFGYALRALAEHTGDSKVAAEAVQVSRKAVDTIRVSDPRWANDMDALGVALRDLYGYTGDPVFLDEAVQVHRKAVAAGHTRHAAHLNNFSRALRALSRRTGDTRLLAEAVQAARDSVAATSDGDPMRTRRLTSLGITLRVLYERTGRTETGTEAVRVLREVIAATPIGHPDRAMNLNNLAGALHVLFGRTGDTALQDEAVQATRDAVDSAPVGHPDHAPLLTNLGISLWMLSERTDDTATLYEAVQAHRDAEAATPADHPNRALCLSNLGGALLALSERTGDTAPRTEAGLCFRQAAESLNLPVARRINLYRMVADLPEDAGGSPQDALASVEAAVRLLAQIVPGSLVRADREHNLGEQSSLAEQAAAAAVTAGAPGRAVELLEQTRGVLVADTLDARGSDLARLRGQRPDLADEFHGLRARIDALGYPESLPGWTDPAGDAQDLDQARRNAQTAWDELIARIRGIDGFADFLQPPGIRQLASFAAHGPIVFVYASQSRCDALVLTDDPATPVRVVSLTNLSEQDVRRQAGRLRHASGALDADPGTPGAAQTEILDVLAWMWETITGPILTALGRTTTPADGQPWPRVWWCPVGGLAYLPLHAAGHHRDLAAGTLHPRTVLDRVISSYTATVRGLTHARTQQPDPATTRTLIIAVPDAPNTAPLRGVVAEADALTDLIPGAHSLLHPTRGALLDTLPGHAVAHFACHGYVDWDDPAASQLILYDHQDAPLTVAAIGALHLTAELAYLSACDTTVTSPALLNEAVHITGAFQLAGYQHVIGTYWPVSDTSARRLAVDFYTQLTHAGSTPPDTGRAASALHHATRRLRRRHLETPAFWAGYTHTGT